MPWLAVGFFLHAFVFYLAARRNYQATSPPEAIEDIPSISVENPLEDGTTCIWQAKVIRESTEDPARKWQSQDSHLQFWLQGGHLSRERWFLGDSCTAWHWGDIWVFTWWLVSSATDPARLSFLTVLLWTLSLAELEAVGSGLSCSPCLCPGFPEVWVTKVQHIRRYPSLGSFKFPQLQDSALGHGFYTAPPCPARCLGVRHPAASFWFTWLLEAGLPWHFFFGPGV